MTKPLFIIGSIFLFLCYSCKDGRKSAPERNTDTQESLKDISELTYQEIFYLLHDEEEYGVDYHGEAFGQDASALVSLVTLDSESCGHGVALRSSEKLRTIQTAVRVSFNFPGNPANEFHRLYTVKPEETHPIGNTKLCYKGSEYTIHREVVSAGFKQTIEN
ncbi:hypothetical protein [Flagellimonas myxillae]|uniref:hypothetical protein n=1 Tax=Flagellimonas myxillae TaxID=2942214 RepID=UPI00201EB54E|nr:hypothetical protein [Muricauda myxillae]MCL6266933.1 hypothetical protein [Muricauda myxillae]